MKDHIKKILFLAVLFFISSIMFAYDQNEIDVFFQNYFKSDYRVLGNFHHDGKRVLLAGKITDKTNVYSSGIVLLINDDNSIKPELYFEPHCIKNSDGSVLMDIEKKIDNEPFGWDITISQSDLLLSLTYYSNNGTNVADSFHLEWDEATKNYIHEEIDWSEF